MVKTVKNGVKRWKIVKMVKNSVNDENGVKWRKIVKTVKNGVKRWKIVLMVKMVLNGEK